MLAGGAHYVVPFFNLKNVKNSHGGVLLLVQTKA